jgi:hypothetical protein
LRDHYGEAIANHAHVVPHLRSRIPAIPRKLARQRLGIGAQDFLICSFGAITPFKMPDRIIQGWRQSRAAATSALVFVGMANAECEALFRAPASGPQPKTTGRIDNPTWHLWLAAADLAIQLRRDSRGETSGAIADCLSAGVPLIVNTHGSAAELPPEAALLLDEACSPEAVAIAIDTVHADRTRAAAMAHAGQALSASHAAPAIAAAYAAIIERAYAQGDAATRLAATNAARATGLAPADIPEVARAIAATWPSPRPRQLLVLARTVPATHLAGWLRHHPRWVRVHPVVVDGDILQQDWQTACELLALPPLPGRPDTAEFGPGDVLLADPAVLPHWLHSQLRLRGVRIHAPAALPDAVSADPASTVVRLMEMS